jgi:TRAP-type C4-dicarboxylate transport system substrate-binding protein
VEKRTKGKVKITNLSGAALGKPPEHYDIAVTGRADIASFVPGYTSGRFPLSSVIELPFLAPNPTHTSNSIWQLYEMFSEIQKEYSDTKLLALFTNDPIQIHSSKKPVRTLDDLQGMKIRVGGQQMASMMKLLGASPVFMSITDVYLGLERGTIDAAVYTLEAVRGFKLQEVSRYCTVANLCCLRLALTMNLDSWNRLPEDIKNLLGVELGGSYLVNLAAKGYEADRKAGIKAMQDAGNELIYLSSDERVKWAKRLQPVRDAWLEDMEAKNLPGKEVLDKALWLEKKYAQ